MPRALVRRERARSRDDVLSAFAARRRRWWAWYSSALAVAAVVVAAAVTIAWSTGEANNAHLSVARQVPPAVDTAPISSPLQLAWRTGDATAIGEPFHDGTVITYSTHTVSGRNALTGAVTWSYTRTNSSICQVAQEQGKTLAMFERDGNCNEIDAFDTDTGTRAWQRALDENMKPVLGHHPNVVVTPDTLFVWTQDSIYAVTISAAACKAETGTNCGYDYWSYPAPTGCLIRHMVAGSVGVLISQECNGVYQLLLRDRYQGTDDTHNRIFWTLANDKAIPATADYFVAAIDPATHELITYNRANGKQLGTLRLSPSADPGAAITRLALPQEELLLVGGTCYALSLSGAAMLWSTSLRTLPTIGDDNGQTVFTTSTQGVGLLSSATGKPTKTYAGPSTQGANQLDRLGSGFLAGGTSTTVLK